MPRVKIKLLKLESVGGNMADYEYIRENLNKLFNLKKDMYSKFFQQEKFYNFFGDSNISIADINKILKLIFKTEENIYVYYDDYFFKYSKKCFFDKKLLKNFLGNYTNDTMYPFMIFSENFDRFLYMDTVFEDIFLLSIKSEKLKNSIEDFQNNYDFIWVSNINNLDLQQRFVSGLYITKKKLKKLTSIYSDQGF